MPLGRTFWLRQAPSVQDRLPSRQQDKQHQQHHQQQQQQQQQQQRQQDLHYEPVRPSTRELDVNQVPPDFSGVVVGSVVRSVPVRIPV